MDCFQYFLKSINSEIVSASIVFNSKSSNISVIIYEVDELFGDLQYIHRLEIKEILENNSIDISSSIQGWVKKRQIRKMIKVRHFYVLF